MSADARAVAHCKRLADIAREEADDAFGAAAYLIAAALETLAPITGALGALDAVATMIDRERRSNTN